MLLLSLLIAQVGLPFSMFAGGAAPALTPTPTPTPVQTQVSTPVISPPDTDAPVSVNISCATSGATIFYTVSSAGTIPSHSGGTPLGSTLVYGGSFSIASGPKVVEAIGYKAGLTDSATAIANYSRGGNQ